MDFYSDTSRGTLGLAKQVVRSVDLEKVAAAAEPAVSALPSGSFGDPITRSFPVHTAADTVLSATYAAMANGTLAPEVMNRIKSASVLWGNKEDVEKVIAEIKAQRPPEVKYAMDLSIGGKHYQLFPFNDGQSLKEAAETFFESRAKMPWAAREKISRVLFEEILSLGGTEVVPVADETFKYLCKAAGFGIPDMECAEAMLLQRMNRARGHQDSFKKVAGILKEAEGSPEWDKFAMDAFDALDGELALKQAYGKTLRLPEEDLYVNSVMEIKTASDEGLVTLMNGKTVKVSEIDWQKVAMIDPVLHEETKGGTEKVAEILATWPRPDADLLMEMLGLQAA
jgi:hypothetical protein